MVDLLRSLADRFPQVILITHIDSVREGFDRVVRVGFDPGERGRYRSRTSHWGIAMWRPDRSVRGPDRPTLRDIESLNRVFADAFTDRYSRDGLVGVRVPHLNHLVWRYALEDAGDGAMVWRDADGQMVAFNMVHRSGTEGWMGPLAVRPDRQGEGLGSTMVRTGIEWLRSQGATTIGLETMPRTVDNIGFYSRIGLVPGHLTVTLVHDVPRRAVGTAELLSAAGAAWEERLEECRRLADRVLPGVDFSSGDRAHAGDRYRRHDFESGGRRSDRLRPVAFDPSGSRPPQGRAPGAQAGGRQSVALSSGCCRRYSWRQSTSGSAGWLSVARPSLPRPTYGSSILATGCTGPTCGCCSRAILSGCRPRAF